MSDSGRPDDTSRPPAPPGTDASPGRTEISSSRDRAISSVADVSLALVLVAAAVAVLVGYHDGGTEPFDPERAPHTAETLGASTLNVTYSLESVLETGSSHVDPPSEAPYDPADLERATHGTAMGHVARAALANAQFPAGDGVARPLAVGDGYAETLNERLLVSLVGSNVATNVTAVWEPFDDSSVRGTATFGQPTPHGVDRSLVHTTVASELPSARERALAAVERTADGNMSAAYAAVAAVVADAIVNGTLGNSQRELETDGVERAVAVSRYLRFADAAPGVSPSYAGATPGLGRSNVDAAAMNAALVDGLTGRFATALPALFDTPTAAAEAVSTGTVTVSVTTWRP